MSKSTAEGSAAPAKQPTVEDVTAIGEAAQGAAVSTVEQGGSADDAGAAAAESARAEAESRGITLPPEVIDQIAKATAAATVTELAQQRAIEPAAPEPPAGEDDQEQDDAAGEPPPVKQTFAAKFLKGYQR